MRRCWSGLLRRRLTREIPRRFASSSSECPLRKYRYTGQTVGPLALDFVGDMQRLIGVRMASWGYGPSSTTDPRQAPYQYLNVVARIPKRVKWTVVESSVLTASRRGMDRPIRTGLNKFLRRARAGEDLRPHVSRSLDDPNFSDALLYDWSITHFHLGLVRDPKWPGFVKRTGKVLYAAVDRRARVLRAIDLGPHHFGFANPELLRIVENEWPDSVRYLPGILPHVGGHPTAEQIYKVRQEGRQPLVSPSGKGIVVPAGGGLNMAGGSALHVTIATQVLDALERLEVRVTDLAAQESVRAPLQLTEFHSEYAVAVAGGPVLWRWTDETAISRWYP